MYLDIKKLARKALLKLILAFALLAASLMLLNVYQFITVVACAGVGYMAYPSIKTILVDWWRLPLKQRLVVAMVFLAAVATIKYMFWPLYQLIIGLKETG